MLKVLAVLLLLCCRVSFANSDDEEKVCEDDKSCFSSVQEGLEEHHSVNFKDLQSAWFSATTIPNRDPQFIRVDSAGNVILGRNFSKNSHLSGIALFDEESKTFPALQQEYYGKGNDDNHENALKYAPKDQSQNAFLDLLEISLRGHLQDGSSEPICWTPSEIHQTMFRFDYSAVEWHKRLFSNNKEFGLLGHNAIFQPMKVFLKRNTLPEQLLRSSDATKTLMFIHNQKPQCSAILDVFDKPEDTSQVQVDIKNNWGLPRVLSFLRRKTPAEMVAAEVNSQKISRKFNAMKTTTAAKTKVTINFDDADDFPELGALSKNK